jgi:hypothetical protein
LERGVKQEKVGVEDTRRCVVDVDRKDKVNSRDLGVYG